MDSETYVCFVRIIGILERQSTKKVGEILAEALKRISAFDTYFISLCTSIFSHVNGENWNRLQSPDS